MRQTIFPLALGTALLAGSPHSMAAPSAFNPHSNGVVTVAVFGDTPYGTTPTDNSQLLAAPAFIDSINADPEVSLALDVGDIHSGKQFCTAAYDQTIFDLFAGFRVPLVYTPGDNEWTDCHKTGEGGGKYNVGTGNIDYVLDAGGNPVDYANGNPADNLDLIRSIFFARPGQALADHKIVLSQAQAFDAAHPTDARFAENVMWEQSHVLFVSVNIPGGSNNDADIWYGAPTMSAAQANEISTRTGADLRWLDAAFAKAAADGAEAVVIQAQADMWDLDGKAPSHIAGYKVFIDRIAQLTGAFGKPVLLFNGDSHVYRSDNPLVSGSPCVTEGATPGSEAACADDAYANQPGGYNVPNFHRLTVHGSTFPLEWLKLTINPRSNATAGANAFGPFSWTRMPQP